MIKILIDYKQNTTLCSSRVELNDGIHLSLIKIIIVKNRKIVRGLEALNFSTY
jgi:hypothetical protein